MREQKICDKDTTSWRGALRAAIAVLAAVLCQPVCARADGLLALPRGALFPDLNFQELVAAEDYPNLGLVAGKGGFALADVEAEVLVLEFMNKHCVPCQTQVRRVESLYGALREEGLSKRVRVLAVAAGNQAKYLPKYRKKRGLSFPIASDPELRQWSRFGEPGRTPLSIFLIRSEDNWVLADYHFGLRDEGWLLAETLEVLEQGVLAGPVSEPAAPTHQGSGVATRPRMDPMGARAAASELLSRVLGRAVKADVVDLADGSRVHRVVGVDGTVVYARLASLEPLCEVCHGVHFLYAFDSRGVLRGFEPVYATKWGNEPWSTEDAAFFESRLVGRSLEGLEFDEEVDAVSRATISSTIMYLEIQEAWELLAELRRLEGSR